MDEADPGGTTALERTRGAPTMDISILLRRGRLDSGEWAYLEVQHLFEPGTLADIGSVQHNYTTVCGHILSDDSRLSSTKAYTTLSGN